MDKEDVKRIINNPGFIPGVYNYCDRWCERCPLTSRCANYATGEEFFPGSEEQGIHNERFWEQLGEVFRVTMEMLKEMAEERGIDLDSLDTSEYEEEHEKILEEAKTHPCVVAADKYAKRVDDWFDTKKKLYVEKGESLQKQVELGLTGSDPFGEAEGLKNATDVIRWHQYQIYVKLMRAMTGLLEGVPEIIKDMPKDSDGSAKVALIGIDRSIGAWGAIRGYFPTEEDEILDILVHLERLRRMTEETFPGARAFVRPGFD
ncbi:MAG: hypothetical protein GXO83_13520 [Chlorobi bacterium]|nr:hypothetical protein [Chlorobiota bacterium]